MELTSVARREAAVRAAAPFLRLGYVIDSVEENGLALRRANPPDWLALTRPHYALFRLLGGASRSIVLMTSEDGRVQTIYR